MNIQQKIDISKSEKIFTKNKDYGILAIGIISTVYLLNFTLGFIEILPDNLPLIGNIDEVVATTVLISVLQYFNIDITKWFKRN